MCGGILPTPVAIEYEKKGEIIMSLLDEWKAVAYNEKQDRDSLQRFWDDYFMKERDVYAQLLKTPDKPYSGTVKALAETFGLTTLEMAGFLDGINESLVKENPIDTMEEDTEVSLDFDNKKLYMNMVDARADWLYNLPEWDEIFDKETQRELYLEQKKSGTIHVGKKIGRNDPCPCGSGKKYKMCHGRKGAPALEL